MTAATSPTRFRRARHLLRTRVCESPTLYLPFARRKYPGPSPEVIGPDTELVIDGYTRSASTFAVYALQLAQPRPVRLAHHLHAPAQLVEAARRHVPALLVIREPRGAVLSQVVREPDVTVHNALVAYCRFHARLLGCRTQLVVGEFGEITHDFAAVIDRLNRRFGLTLARFEHTEQNLTDCFELVARRDSLSPVLLGFESGTVTASQLREEVARLARTGGAATDEATWAPSAKRDECKGRLQAQWDDAGLTRLRDRAQRMFETFVAGREAVP